MSEETRDDEHLLRLVRSVADGTPVDWEGEATAGRISDRQAARLRIIAAIAETCGMPAEGAGPAEHDAPRPAPLFRWGHLEVFEKVGEGVFGEVHRAWETTLAREVAVKFLRHEPGDAVAHVLEEGRNLARVRHPGVVTVHGAESHDRRIGIWMEFIRGLTLEDLLQRQGAMGAAEAAAIGRELCRALTAVHQAGLVHNDVKTRNVMREEGGRIVLMDFGTGTDPRRRAPAGAPTLTGTPFYLAPELLRGEPISARSDLYSLGVLLFRLVTRAYPYEAVTLDELRGAQRRGERKLLRDLRADLPEPFLRVVERALDADPAKRFATAGELEMALAGTLRAGPAAEDPGRRGGGGRAGATPGTKRRRGFALAAAALLIAALGFVTLRELRGRVVPPSATRVSIAVADFVNETGEPDLDGLSGMLATSLDQSRSLSLLTRSRMHDLLERLGRPPGRLDESRIVEIGRQAGLDALVLPSIRRFGDRYRIDLQVLDPGRDEYLFTAQETAGGREEIPAAIDRLSRRTRTALREHPSRIRGTGRPVAQIVTANLEAHHWYDLGERQIDRLDMAAARTSLERAVSLDSTFGLAYSRLAYVCWWLDDGESERRMARKAWSLVDRLPDRERYRLRAQRAVAEGEGLAAGRTILLEMERFYPDDKQMLYSIGDLSSHLSEHPLAVRYLERVLEQDPNFVPALQHLARTYRQMGRRQAMLAYARRYFAADSGWESSLLLGEAQVAVGDFASGVATLTRGRDLHPGRPMEFGVALARAHAFAGADARASQEWRMLLGAASPALVRAAREELAWREAARGRHRSALALVERNIESCRREGDPRGEAIARLDRARLIHLGSRDAAPARAELEWSRRNQDVISPRDHYFDYWPYWGGLFKLLLRCGMTTEAERLARERFASDKWHGPYVEAYLECARGEPLRAWAAARQVLDWGVASENVEFLSFLADCQLRHGDSSAAAASLARRESFRTNLVAETPEAGAVLRSR